MWGRPIPAVKGSVTGISPHPSPTRQRDKMVKLWDMVKADCAFSFKNPIPSVSEQIRWSPSGERFSLSSQDNVSMFDAENSKVRMKNAVVNMLWHLSGVSA